MITNTAQRNLSEAAEIEKSSNWTIARLIASSVEASQGRRSDLVSQDMKFGINEAASVMGRSNKTIRAYLDAWNAAAADGLCAPSSDLTPEDGWTAHMPDAEDWEKYKNPNSHSAPAPAKAEKIPAEPAVAVQSWTPEQKQEMVRQLVSEDSEVAAAAEDAAMQHKSVDEQARAIMGGFSRRKLITPVGVCRPTRASRRANWNMVWKAAPVGDKQ